MSILRQVAAALAKAAERGIVHRDIKPENIMLRARPAKSKWPTSDWPASPRRIASLDLTQVGITLGTPLYMSPEQVEGQAARPAQRPLFARRDLLPHADRHARRSTARRRWPSPCSTSRSEPARLEDLRPDLPGGLCRIVHQMLAKDPAQRYPDASELLRDLRTLGGDGLAEVWPDEIEPGELGEAASATSSGRTAATQQLAAVMATESLALPAPAYAELVGFSEWPR